MLEGTIVAIVGLLCIIILYKLSEEAK